MYNQTKKKMRCDNLKCFNAQRGFSVYWNDFICKECLEKESKNGLIPSGKFKGKKISDVIISDKSYIEYILKSTDKTGWKVKFQRHIAALVLYHLKLKEIKKHTNLESDVINHVLAGYI